jgi:hypothetical protein
LSDRARKRVVRLQGDYAAGKPVKLLDRWKKIDADTEGELLDAYGAPPLVGIETVPWDRTLRYACRDADATGRVYPLLLGMLAAYGDMDAEGVDA